MDYTNRKKVALACFFTFICGAIFGGGLSVSQMINPKKVLDFLDVTGDWDPTLLVVMAGATITTFIIYRFVFRGTKPIFNRSFHIPYHKEGADTRLYVGSALFGVGWGLVGLCPGPVISGISYGAWEVFVFIAAMYAGFVVARRVTR